jgi:16S rRNA (cytidine1402-2'-O)-methyltransferase
MQETDQTAKQGKLYLVPSTIGGGCLSKAIPGYNLDVIQSIHHYIVEKERTARRMLISMGIKTPIDELAFTILNKHTPESEKAGILAPLLQGKNMGLLSEAGLPCVADPGSGIVQLAHRQHIEVVPLVGPSSVFLSLMASGLNGQSFCFHGYLPIPKNERVKAIKRLEKTSRAHQQTQVFIETPYRNNKLLDDLIQNCHPGTLLCVAANLQTPEEFIKTRPMGKWKKQKPNLHKIPCIFLIGH